ncbi:HEAT repeat domain-containing protein [Novipirellula artificiosorum]|uniref:HEAT repeat protein n=1 Tax=Novipirellula artificiosorum TaxID=2528016 RepID=A0A5C6D252_9BACT|nr:HEAT repeat domain-containing protein [Novipirellula artificiosorum]TWU31012.1 hypothetical protein Poly41_64810 [Novipirellula artificiosorum]
MLDQAFEALLTFDWGSDLNAVKPIDEAIVATTGDAAARTELESRLVEVLNRDVSRDAKDYVCRALAVIGTAISVPTLAAMLSDAELSHMARYALQPNPAPDATTALRDALPKTSGVIKVGVIGSLGAKHDAESIPMLAGLLNDADPRIARAAAIALGEIRTPKSAAVLTSAKSDDVTVALAITDGSLSCAESMLAAGNKMGALKVYKTLMANADSPKHIKLAVTRGMLACAGK